MNTHKIQNIIILIIFILLSSLLCFSINNNNTKNISTAVIPQYDRHLSRVVFTLSIDNFNLDIHDNLIKCLPDYSEITILLPDINMDIIEEYLKEKQYGDRVNLITYTTELIENINYYLVFPESDKIIYGNTESKIIPNGSIWAQDLFIVTEKDNGTKKLLISETYKWFTSVDNNSENIRLKSDNSFLNNLSSLDIEIERTNFMFSGGNIILDKIDNKVIAFCGYDIIRKTQLVWKSIDNLPEPDEVNIAAAVKNYLNADEVIFFDYNSRQPNLMFHLDQAMLLVDNKKIFLTNISDMEQINYCSETQIEEITNVNCFLETIRIKLEEMGYKVINLDTSIKNILNNQFYANAIPYIDLNTGLKTVLLPVFSDDDFDEELSLKNIAVLEESGYAVIPVRDYTNTVKGGIHCLINVLD